MRDELEIRPYSKADKAAVLSLLQASLGWVPDDLHASFFAWKHEANPFGSSPAWVATDGDRVVGFRTFLRWRFTWNGETCDAVRAVDTATHPDYQGRGIFSRLTLHALEQLRDEGVDFVFNTPNAQSRPGYLKMGWKVVGRLPVLVRPRSPLSMIRMARARVPADKWSLPCDAGDPATEVLTSDDDLLSLLETRVAGPGIATSLSPAFLRWRYGFGPLSYRAVTLGGSVANGLAIFRLRRRGRAREAAICEVMTAPREPRAVRALVREVINQSGADYAVRIARLGDPRAGSARLPRQGPWLTWRAVARETMPQLEEWRVSLGDIELF